MKIGITERGDAGLDLSWISRIYEVDGVILITKNINDKFINSVVSLSKIKPMIVHCTCTGFGSSKLEPNVPDYTAQIDNLKKLIDAGFPISNVVLRIDPIIPDVFGEWNLMNVLDYIRYIELPIQRIRISIYDEYKHVKERLRSNGIEPFYGKYKNCQNKSSIQSVVNILLKYPYEYEVCAEDALADMSDRFKKVGCVSKTDLEIMGLFIDEELGENPQGRSGCHCLSCKYELLTNKHRCDHKCLYCYWRD